MGSSTGQPFIHWELRVSLLLPLYAAASSSTTLSALRCLDREADTVPHMTLVIQSHHEILHTSLCILGFLNMKCPSGLYFVCFSFSLGQAKFSSALKSCFSGFAHCTAICPQILPQMSHLLFAAFSFKFQTCVGSISFTMQTISSITERVSRWSDR